MPSADPELHRLYPIMDRGSDAKTHPKGITTVALMQPHSGCARHPIDAPLRAGEPCSCSHASVWLAPNRIDWIENRHKTAMGSRSTSQRWLDWTKSCSRPANSLLALSPEADYLLTKVLGLQQQICTNIFTASRAADSLVFRSGTDGNMFDEAGEMYSPTGTFCVLPSPHERERILQNAFEKWDDGKVATAMIVPSAFWAEVQEKRNKWNKWGPVDSFVGYCKPLVLHLAGNGGTPLFSTREVQAEGNHPPGACQKGGTWGPAGKARSRSEVGVGVAAFRAVCARLNRRERHARGAGCRTQCAPRR
eukprot:gene9679-24183_t